MMCIFQQLFWVLCDIWVGFEHMLAVWSTAHTHQLVAVTGFLIETILSRHVNIVGKKHIPEAYSSVYVHWITWETFI